MQDVPLGTLVFRAGLLTEEKLEEALQEAVTSGKRLGDILLERGLVSENDLGRLLAGQKGLPFVELDPAAIDPTAPPILHSEKARLLGALPIGFEAGVPVVAVADPLNDLVIENVRRALNCEPVLVVAGRDALYHAIDAAYSGQVQPPAPVATPSPAEPVTEAPALTLTESFAAVAPESDPPVMSEPAAPVVEPTPTVSEPLAYEPTPDPEAPVAETVAADSAAAVTPIATQPTANGDGLWLGELQEAAPKPVDDPPPMDPAVAHEPIQTVQIVESEAVLSPEPVVAAPAASPVEPDPDVPSQPPAPAEISWIVEVRLANGERIEVSTHVAHHDALDEARDVVAQASTEGSWPFLGGRFLRPDAIVSVDLVEVSADRSLGSSARDDAPQP